MGGNLSLYASESCRPRYRSGAVWHCSECSIGIFQRYSDMRALLSILLLYESDGSPGIKPDDERFWRILMTVANPGLFSLYFSWPVDLFCGVPWILIKAWLALNCS
jgi:hypothetical protein